MKIDYTNVITTIKHHANVSKLKTELSWMIREYDDSQLVVFYIYRFNDVDTRFRKIFCILCGSYVGGNIKSITCNCNKIPTQFSLNKHLLEKSFYSFFKRNSIEDVIEDIEYDDIHPCLGRYFLKTVLFGMTYKKYYHNQIKEVTIDRILDFLVDDNDED